MAIELYNGVTLPDIPNEVLSQYPYVTICWVGTSIIGSEADYIYNATESPQMYIDQTISGGSSSGRMVMVGCIGNGVQGVLEPGSAEWQDIDFDGTDGIVAAVLSVEGSDYNGSLMWANHDVMHGIVSEDQNSITSTGEKYEYEVALVDYNGEKLPAIPEELLVQYPNAVIIKSTQYDERNITIHGLCLGDSEFMYIPPEEMPAAYSDVEGGLFHPSTNGVLYNLAPSMSWQMIKNSVSSIVTPIGTGDAASINIIWANHDIFIAEQSTSGIGYVATDEVYDYIIDFVDYNGVLLPDLPSSIYPYATILNANNVDNYHGYLLIMTSDEFYAAISDTPQYPDVLFSNTEAAIYLYVDTYPSGNWVYINGTQGEKEELQLPINQTNCPMGMWTNHDIKIMTYDEGGNPVITDKIYDYIVNFVDYNGVMLPELPQVDYSNAVIFDATNHSEISGYVVSLCENNIIGMPTSYTGEEYDILYTPGKVLSYIYAEHLQNWLLISRPENGDEVPINDPENPITILWAKNDIMVGGIFNDIVFESDEVYFPLRSEDTLPDVEYWSEYYTVPTRWLSSVAKQTRRITGDYTRMTTDKIEEALTGFGSYKKVFNKTIEEIDFALPMVLSPYSFLSCVKLKEVTSDRVKIIDEYAFSNCTSLIQVDFPSATEVYWGVFNECMNLEEVNLPNATNIEGSCFWGCEKLKTINIEKVEFINNNTFTNCVSITNIDLPSVKRIYGYYTFNNCVELKSLILRNEEKVELYSYSDMFTDTPIENGTGYIYVPAALVDTYKADDSWSNWASQFRALEDYTVDGTITGELDESKI